MCKIKIIDDIMGAGKTTTIINHMNNNSSKKFIYITPYLDEVERIKNNCPNLRFNDPKATGSKLRNLNYLIAQNRNIASTHALFKTTTEETRILLKNRNYTLVLDEVMDVIDNIEITKDDLETLERENLIIYEGNFILWNPEKQDYDGTFTRYKLKSQSLIIDLKELCNTKSIMRYKDNILIWNFPTSIFKCFDDVYILTYLFDGQVQKYYFDLHNVEYEYYHIENNTIAPGKRENYKEIKNNLKEKITIYEGKINSIGDEPSLSKNWYIRNSNPNSTVLKELRNNLLNFFTNIAKGKTNDNMWTTFKDYRRQLKGKGYSKGFVPINERSTNKYAHKKYLAYTINRYMQTIVANFFGINNIKVNQDLYAASELVQWIWRSRIRNDEPIIIYIPSERMRNLFIKWLNDEKI